MPKANQNLALNIFLVSCKDLAKSLASVNIGGLIYFFEDSYGIQDTVIFIKSKFNNAIVFNIIL